MIEDEGYLTRVLYTRSLREDSEAGGWVGSWFQLLVSGRGIKEIWF